MAYSKTLSYTFETKGSAEWFKNYLSDKIKTTKGLSNFWSDVGIKSRKEYSYSGLMVVKAKPYETTEADANSQYLRKLAVDGHAEWFKHQKLVESKEQFTEREKHSLRQYAEIASKHMGIAPEGGSEDTTYKKTKQPTFMMRFSLDHASEKDLAYLDETVLAKELTYATSMPLGVFVEVPMFETVYGKDLMKHVASQRYTVEAKIAGKKDAVDRFVRQNVPSDSPPAK